jgi:predicted Rossmann fold nucleotide-binding protein DprA/Smf involved in DNA uptake
VRRGVGYRGVLGRLYSHKGNRVVDPALLGAPTIKRQGITRMTGARAPLRPPTGRQMMILELLGDEPVSQTPLARRLGLSVSAVASDLYALQRRGLAEREPYRGWIRL